MKMRFFWLAWALCAMASTACDKASTAATTVPTVETPAEQVDKTEKAASPEYLQFRDEFVEITLPHIIGPNMDPELPALPHALQMQFLEHSSDATRPYGKFPLADGFDCLVTVEDPTEGVHYIVLYVFSPVGKKLSSLEIAGNDGNEYNGFLRGDKKISVTESPNEGNGLKEAKERIYEINSEGQIVPSK